MSGVGGGGGSGGGGKEDEGERGEKKVNDKNVRLNVCVWAAFSEGGSR